MYFNLYYVQGFSLIRFWVTFPFSNSAALFPSDWSICLMPWRWHFLPYFHQTFWPRSDTIIHQNTALKAWSFRAHSRHHWILSHCTWLTFDYHPLELLLTLCQHHTHHTQAPWLGMPFRPPPWLLRYSLLCTMSWCRSAVRRCTIPPRPSSYRHIILASSSGHPPQQRAPPFPCPMNEWVRVIS